MSNMLYSQKYDNNIQELDSLLCKVYNTDQEIRSDSYKMFNASIKQRTIFQNKLDSIDSYNQNIVFNILDSIGWPSNLSEIANRGIFIVIDHSKLDKQKKYLPMVKEASQKGLIEKGDYATLLDRILMKSNVKQIYGTQTITQNTQANQVILYIWPIQEPEKIDSLRKSVNLPPIEEYIKLVSQIYKQPCYWDKNRKIEDFNN